MFYFYSFRSIRGPQFESALPPCVLAAFYLFEKAYEELAKGGFSRPVLRSDAKRIGLAALLIFGVGCSLFSQKRFYQDGKLSGWFLYQTMKFGIIKDPDRGFVEKRLLGMRPVAVGRARGIWLVPAQADEMERVVAAVRANTKENEPVFTFPDLGIFNYLCDRPAVSRFPLTGEAWIKKEWRRELLCSLANDKPRLALVDNELTDFALTTGRTEEILPEIRQYLDGHYRLQERIGSVDIYVLR
jgi:hypothetical protein